MKKYRIRKKKRLFFSTVGSRGRKGDSQLQIKRWEVSMIFFTETKEKNDPIGWAYVSTEPPTGEMMSGQIIATFLYAGKGLVTFLREVSPKFPDHSGLGIILICPDKVNMSWA